MSNSILLAQIISATLIYATPLIYTALGGIISENSGVVNIGLEGMMVIGAFTAAVVTYFTGSPWLGFLCGGLAGAFFGALHAIACVTFVADQVISGIAINMLAPGIAIYMAKILFNGSNSTEPVSKKIPRYFDGIFEKNTFLDIVFNTYFTTYIVFILVIVVWYVLFKTKIGLRIRAIGEHPQASDTLGINVNRIKYACVITSGFFAGMGGASMSIALISSFRVSLVSGHGFIAIAALILGRWKPFGTMFSALFFGLCSGLAIVLGNPQFNIKISQQLLSMLPYASTVILLIIIGNKYNGPSANGLPYKNGGR
jgi:general nucleoside transport system permease protein